MMDTSMGPALQVKKKICEACGEEFSCKAMATGCWCEEIQLSAAARAEIADRYKDCLCRSCLAQFAAET